MIYTEDTLTALCRAVRSMSEDTKEEVEELANSCLEDLRIAGVRAYEMDPLVLQAMKLYCKANYGYDAEVDVKKFREGYEHLKIAMALSGEYR